MSSECTEAANGCQEQQKGFSSYTVFETRRNKEGLLLSKDGRILTGGKEKAELLSSYLASTVFQKRNRVQPCPCSVTGEVSGSLLKTDKNCAIKPWGPDELSTLRKGEEWTRDRQTLSQYSKRGRKNQENVRLVSLVSLQGKIREQIINESICKHFDSNAVINRSKLLFDKNKSYQVNPISFWSGCLLNGAYSTTHGTLGQTIL